MSTKKVITIFGATGPARALRPRLQSFAQWLSANAQRIPLE